MVILKMTRTTELTTRHVYRECLENENAVPTPPDSVVRRAVPIIDVL